MGSGRVSRRWTGYEDLPYRDQLIPAAASDGAAVETGDRTRDGALGSPW